MEEIQSLNLLQLENSPNVLYCDSIEDFFFSNFLNSNRDNRRYAGFMTMASTNAVLKCKLYDMENIFCLFEKIDFQNTEEWCFSF